MTATLPEDTTPILFKSAQEFQTRDGYLPELRCEKDALHRIVGKYSFTEKEQLQCGLNGCKKLHWNGWVIRSKDGRETHCGKDCGEREFKVLFKEVLAVFKAAEERQSKKERIEQVLHDRDALLAEARGLYAQVSSAGNRVNAIVSEIRKDGPFERAFNDCLRSDGRIQVEDRESRRLLYAMGASGARANLKTIGVLKGFLVVSSASRVANELKYRVLAPLEELTSENLDVLTIKELSEKSSLFGNFRQITSRANKVLVDFEQFISPANLQAYTLLQQAVPKKSRTSRTTRVLERISEQYTAVSERYIAQ